MREIKFRAWDKKKKRFFYVVLHPTQLQWGSPKYTSQELLKEIDDDISGVSFKNIEGWQEYTGLKDKNGKDVYEGDIVKVPIQEDQKIVEVYLEIGLYMQCYPFNSYDLNEMGYGSSDESEIIGNIYENKELLK